MSRQQLEACHCLPLFDVLTHHDMTLHLSFDFAQQVFYILQTHYNQAPYTSWHPVNVAFLEFAVRECPFSWLMRSNAVISYLHDFVETCPSHLSPHADNFVGQNKNNIMLQVINNHNVHTIIFHY